VGESGAGKSMIWKAILGILPRAAEVVAGEIRLEGMDLLALPPGERRRQVRAMCALIPQDPLTALNPSRRIGPQVTDRLADILGWRRAEAEARAQQLLAEVQIADPERAMRAYPHEVSGGMRQRVLIASALAAGPRLIVADEPTTALDVTVQKQILRLIAGMQARHGTALLFVTHDLGVVSKCASRSRSSTGAGCRRRRTCGRSAQAPYMPIRGRFWRRRRAMRTRSARLCRCRRR
jgi:peptide/nickel transport system ATP-binding protein